MEMEQLIEKNKANCYTNPLLKGNELNDNFVMDYLSIDNDFTTKTGVDLFDSTLKNNTLPDIEFIANSLRKVQEITTATKTLWLDKKVSGKIATDAIKIMNYVIKRNFSFCNGKNIKCLSGGLLYLLSYRYDDPRTQREIALVLQITDISIRLYYKRWLREFPELFQDIVEKLSDQTSHRYQFKPSR
jgi:hypothetical protein